MRLQRKVATCVLLVCLSAGCATWAPSPVSLPAILNNNAIAVRGELPMRLLPGTEKNLQILEGGAVLNARYRATSNGEMRIDVFHEGERVFSEGIDAAGAWEWPGGDSAPTAVTHVGAAALARGIDFNLLTLSEMAQRGHEIELVEKTRVHEQDYFLLKITLRDGFETYRYVNADTWLVDIARDERAYHPGIDPEEQIIETRLDRWTLSDGVRYAGRSRDFDGSTGELIATVLVLDSTYDVRPAELDLSRNWLPDALP